MIRLHPLILLALIPIFTACSKEDRSNEGAPLQSNPVKEYINVPKEKAREAGDAVKERQDEEKRQLDETTNDD